MNEQDEPKANPKDKPLYKDPVKMVPLIGATIAAILGGIALYGQIFPPSPPSNSSVEYVLDTSADMKGKLGEQNKFESVKDHILRQVDGFPNVPAALRLAGGGSCEFGYQPPSVEFEEDNHDDFETTLTGLRPSGASDLVSALTHAANDLVQRGEQASNELTTVYVFYGSADECTSNPEDRIRAALSALRAQENVEVDFKLIGVNPPEEARRLLTEVDKVAGDLGFSSSVTFAKEPSDLIGSPPYCDLPAQEDHPRDCQ
ncbi:MAG TPA: VWA domain-containing protein [Nocardioidaceae bacterium]|nr:VWA domain-containing protein [Nocardioidaceae bacterium]